MSSIDRMQGPCSPDRVELHAILTDLASAGQCTACAPKSTIASKELFDFPELHVRHCPLQLCFIGREMGKAFLAHSRLLGLSFSVFDAYHDSSTYTTDKSLVWLGDAMHSDLSREWLSELQLLRAWHLVACLDTFATHPYLFRITLGAKPSSAPVSRRACLANLDPDL